MNKEFIPYEQALELKELGFDEPCLAVYRGGSLYGSGTSVSGYYEDAHWQLEKNSDYGGDKNQWVSAPLYQQAFRWFREKYDLFSYIDILERPNGKVIYDYVIVNNDLAESEDNRRWKTFEEAELECLKQLIKITKNK